MRRIRRLFAGMLAALMSMVASVACAEETIMADMEAGADGQWPMLYGNPQQNGHSALPGAMTEAPEVIAEYDLRAFHRYALIAMGDGVPGDGVPGDGVPGESLKGMTAPDIEARYDINGVHHEVGGVRATERIVQDSRYASLYEGQLNYLYIDASYFRDNERTSTLVVCQVHEGGGMTELWRSELPYYHERPHIVLADMDQDGVTDIAVLGWEGIVVFNGTTHAVMMHLPQSEGWHGARKRGIFAAEDIDGDGYPELLVFSFYPWDVNVIDNDGEKLSVKWFHVYDNDIASAWQVSRYPRQPYGDIDGDGAVELAYSVWNAHGDGQWHVEIRDALTGAVKHDIPNVFLHDIQPLGDGRLALFTAASQGSSVPEYTTLRVYAATPDAATEIYTCEGAYMTCVDDISRDNVAVHTGMFKRSGVLTLVMDRTEAEPAFFVTEKTDGGYVMRRHTVSGPTPGFSAAWADGTDVSLWKQGESGALLASVVSAKADAKVTVEGGAIELTDARRENNGHVYLPIAALFEGETRLLVSDQMENAVMLALDEGGLAVRYRGEGLGMAYEYATHINYGYVAADVNGDGENEWLARVSTERGAGVRCMDAQGNQLWETVFPMFHCENDMELLGKLSFLGVANVGGEKVVIVNGQRNVQHTGITYGLSGATGEILWEIPIIREGGSHASGAGAYYISTADITGDGTDEVFGGYGNNVWAADAKTGKILFNNFMRGLFENHWIQHYHNGWVSNMRLVFLSRDDVTAKLFVADSDDSTGVLEVVYGDSPEARQEAFRRSMARGGQVDMNNLAGALQESRATMLWANEDWDARNLRQQCVGRVLGDGRVMAVEACALEGGVSQVVRVVDPETGEIAASHTLGGAGDTYLLSCDINGDGTDDILVTYGGKLIALTVSEGKLVRLWDKSLLTSTGWPIWADLNGDGLGEIAVYTTDGKIRVLGMGGTK